MIPRGTGDIFIFSAPLRSARTKLYAYGARIRKKMKISSRPHGVSLLLALVILFLGGVVNAKEPQRKANPPLPVTALNLMERGPDVQTVLVEVEVGKGMENPQWALTFTNIQVLLGKLQDEAMMPPMKPALLALAKEPEPAYKGMKVMMQTVRGEKFQALKVYKGRISAGGALVREDVGRGLEYWLFSTARVRRDLNLGASLVPVWTFEQCRVLGMQVVDTEPRQCLLPDGGIVLQTADEPTKGSLKVTDFEGCLKHGASLVATFPRRCVVAGGKVFTEPPQVKEEEPADAPLAEGATTRLDVPSATVVVELSATVVNNPLLGSYEISPATPKGLSSYAKASEDRLQDQPSADGHSLRDEAVSLTVIVSGSEVISTSASGVSASLIDLVPAMVDVAPAAGPAKPATWWERLNMWWGR